MGIKYDIRDCMRLTTKGRYAVTAMIDIALHSDVGPVSVLEISRRQDISAAYLEQIIRKLKLAGLLNSVRGPGGGYVLGRGSDSISVSKVIQAVGEGVDVTLCHGSSDCQDGERCLTHDLWAELSTEIDDFLAGISLAQLIDKPRVKTIALRQNDQLIDARLV